MKVYLFIALFAGVFIAVLFFAVWKFNSAGNLSESPKPTMNPEIADAREYNLTLKTNFGEIEFKTYSLDAPKTVRNFVDLAQKGFYNGVIFHRVIKDFMIQGGDPNCKPSPDDDSGMCGTGGPGYKFDDEINANSQLYREGYQKGIVAMANAGPNTNGSQFFIMLKDTPLPPLYTIFGKVTKGQDVIDQIGLSKTDANDRPVAPVALESILVQ